MSAGILASAAAPAADPPGTPRPWWENRWFVAAMIALAFVPLVYPRVPPLVDLLGHMGRYRVELDLARSPDLARYFDFKWHLIGNLGVDLLVYPLGKLIGLEPAVKAIALIIPPLTVAGFLWVAREVHHRLPPTVAFALPFAFGHPFLYGFLNYSLSMALAFLAFGLWLRLGRLGKDRLRLALFVPISFVLYVCHTFGWGTLGLLCFSAEAVRQHDRGIGWWRAGLIAAGHAAVMLGPLFLMLAWREDVSRAMTRGWFNWELKLLWITTALRDRWQVFDIAMLAIAAMIFGFALLSRWLTFSRNLAFSALVLLGAFLIIPWTVFGSAFADMRLVPFAMATILLAIRFRAETRLVMARVLAIAGVGYYLAKIVATTASLAIAADDQAVRLQALDHVPRGAALVSLVGQPCHSSYALFRNSHLPAMAIVRRDAFANDQWAVEGANLLSVTYPGAGAFRADPSQMVKPAECATREARPVDRQLAAIPRQSFDYVWLIDPPSFDPRAASGLRPVWRGEGSLLYATDRSTDSAAP